MKISYSLELEDLLNWNLYHFRNSPAMRKTKHRTMAIGTATIWFALLWINHYQLTPKYLFTASIWLVVFCQGFAVFLEKNISRTTRKVYEEGEN